MKTASIEQVDHDATRLTQLMQTPIDHYNSQRIENEVDLIQEVRGRMIAVGLMDKVIQAYDTNRFIIEAIGRTSHAQQYNLNRYLSLQFMAAKEDAQMQRYSLIYEINAQEWLTIFDATILPALVEFDLPVVV